MKKRILTVLLAVCLVVALGTVTAMADDTLPASGEITLDSNVVLSSTWSITGDVVLDLMVIPFRWAQLLLRVESDMLLTFSLAEALRLMIAAAMVPFILMFRTWLCISLGYCPRVSSS